MNSEIGLPKITIVTVVFNGEKYLQDTISSVAALNYPFLEYIIIDGRSMDGTLELIKKNEAGITHWISEKDKGIYDAMNKGISLAKGEWINFMNCGDRFASPEALNFFMSKKIEADVVYGNAIAEYPTFNTSIKIFPMEKVWKEMPFCHQACFVRTEVMRQFKFDLKYRFSSDYDFILRAYKAGKKFMHVNDTICYYDFKEGASLKHVVNSIKERKASALANEYSHGKWLYYQYAVLRISLTCKVKKVIGTAATSWLTRAFRK